MSIDRLLRLPKVKQVTGWSGPTIYLKVRKGEFPPPVKIGPRASAWVESEVRAWIDEKVQERDQLIADANTAYERAMKTLDEGAV